MSTFDEKELKTPEAPEEVTSEKNTDETLTLEDLAADVTEEPLTFTATLHFEFSDIFNAIEHIETGETEPEEVSESEATEEPELDEPEQPDDTAEPEELEQEDSVEPEDNPEEPEEPAEPAETLAATEDPESAPDTEPELESEVAPEPEAEIQVVSETESEPESETEEPNPTPEPEPESEPEAASEPEPETSEPQPEKQSLRSKLTGQDSGTKKLLLTVCILFAVIAVSITIGLASANSLVNKANAANEEKIAQMQENIKEVNLSESLYDMAADQVIDDVAVPTYTLDELYALDLREKTGFTAEDLKVITRKGLVGCEEAFVKAEETYGVNSIFLVSIASLESAHGTMMFRPNNMFGYGRTGFSSKEECIMTVAKGLGTRYLPPGGSLYGGSPTLKGVNQRYAANPQWYYKVGKYMQGYYAELAAEKNGALDKFE